MTNPVRQTLLAAAPLVLSLLTAGSVLATAPGCTSAGVGKGVQVGQTVLDVGDAICDALTANDIGGDKVQIVCKYITTADSVAHVFIATVPQSQAAKMGIYTPKMLAAKSVCPPAPSPAAAPTPSASGK